MKPSFGLLLVMMLFILTGSGASDEVPNTDHDTSQDHTQAAIVVGTSGLSQQELQYWKHRTANAIGSPESRKEIAAELDHKYPGDQGPEVIRMLKAITQDVAIGPEDGWFGPGQSKYGWSWLADRYQVAVDQGITASQAIGAEDFFKRLDRNGDGILQSKDFDWSADADWVKQATTINQLFRAMDIEGNNRVSKEELLAFFDQLRGKSPEFSSEDLRDSILRGRSSYLHGDAPTPDRLLNGLFNNELGSVHEGPSVGSLAPPFRLMTHDGKEEISLEPLLGSQPIVLVFGNFTCGPFRRNLPEVEDLHQRYRDKATFLGVYVREAHPTDGWLMSSNTKSGVEFSQPKTYDERVQIASTCHARLNYTMPLLVDTIDDQVGDSYSGMPARFYVIDAQGMISYKSGRGPYGLKTGELEQALILTLLAAPQLP